MGSRSLRLRMLCNFLIIYRSECISLRSAHCVCVCAALFYNRSQVINVYFFWPFFIVLLPSVMHVVPNCFVARILCSEQIYRGFPSPLGLQCSKEIFTGTNSQILCSSCDFGRGNKLRANGWNARRFPIEIQLVAKKFPPFLWFISSVFALYGA